MTFWQGKDKILYFNPIDICRNTGMEFISSSCGEKIIGSVSNNETQP
jgi:hypothetical protein